MAASVTGEARVVESRKGTAIAAPHRLSLLAPEIAW
jgi:hypothetical protein